MAVGAVGLDRAGAGECRSVRVDRLRRTAAGPAQREAQHLDVVVALVDLGSAALDLGDEDLRASLIRVQEWVLSEEEIARVAGAPRNELGGVRQTDREKVEVGRGPIAVTVRDLDGQLAEHEVPVELQVRSGKGDRGIHPTSAPRERFPTERAPARSPPPRGPRVRPHPPHRSERRDRRDRPPTKGARARRWRSRTRTRTPRSASLLQMLRDRREEDDEREHDETNEHEGGDDGEDPTAAQAPPW